ARAVELRRRALGPDDPRLAQSVYDLADAYLETNPDSTKLARADTLAHEAFRIRHRAFGEEGIEMAWSYHQLGRLRLSRYQLAAAESLQRKAIAIGERTKGSDTLLMFWTHEQLADILANRNKND